MRIRLVTPISQCDNLRLLEFNEELSYVLDRVKKDMSRISTCFLHIAELKL